MLKKAYRTATTRIKPGPLAQAFEALELAGKNLRNTGVFLVKNVLSSFRKNEAGIYELKADLHANQKQAIAEIERAIDACNATRRGKAAARKAQLHALEKLHAEGLSGLDEEGMTKAREASSPPKLFEPLASARPNPWVVLDGSVFDKALRTHKDERGERVFAALPAKFAEQIGMGIRNDFSTWRKSVKAFTQNSSAFQAPPDLPGYMDPNALATCKIFAGAVGSRLPSIEGRPLFLDFKKTLPLPLEARAAYAAFDLGPHNEAHASQLAGLSRRGAPTDAVSKPLHVGKVIEYRLVPGRLGATSFQSVREVGFEIRDASFLGQTLSEFESRPEASKAQAFDDFAKAKLAGLHAQDLPACSGADLGLANLACLGHASGREAWILSATRIDRKLARFDAKIDARLSELASASPPALHALRARRSALTSKEALKDGISQEEGATAQLSTADVRLLRAGDAFERKDPRLGRLRDARESFLADAVHQASDGIVQEVLRAGSEVLVVGQNKLWKTGSTLGPTQNRRFHRLPHARLIEQIRIKAEAASILTLCVEESYTSRTSFAAGEPLATLGGRPAAKSKPASRPVPPQEKILKIQGGAKPRRQAPKGAKASSPKHQMHTPRPAFAASFGLALDRRWERLHADLNGAYNILRKAMPAFSPAGSGAASPSPSFRLRWLSAEGPRAFRPV